MNLFSKKEKLVKKYLPVEVYDIAGLERWLSQMEEQGLYLVKGNCDQAWFRPGPPRAGTRYALEVTGPYDIDRERNEDYAQMGWHYVTTLRMSLMVSLYYVYRTEDPSIPALHTDPVTQSTTVTKLIRRLRRTLIILAVLMALLYRNELIAFFRDPWSAPRLVLLRTEQAALWLLIAVVCLLLYLGPALHYLRGLVKVRRQLAAGIPLVPRPRKVRVPYAARQYGVILLIPLVLAGSLWLSRHQSWTLSAPEDYAFPHITLSQALEGSGITGLTPESPYDKMLHPDRFRRSFLCPEQYQFSQAGDGVFSDGVRPLFLTVDYYAARSPQGAQVLLPALMAEQMEGLAQFQRRQDDYVSLSVLTLLSPFQAVPFDGLEELYCMEYQLDDGPVTRCYMGRRGEQVFCLLLRGIPEPERCLSLLAEQLK